MGDFLDDQIFSSRKEVVASVVLEESQDHGSIFPEIQCCCRLTVHGSRKVAPRALAASLGSCRIRGMLSQPRSPQPCSDTHSDPYPFIQPDLEFLFIAQSPGSKKLLIHRKFLEFPFQHLLHKDLNIIIKPTLYILFALSTFSAH